MHISMSLKFTIDYHFEYEVYLIVLQINLLGFDDGVCSGSLFVCLFEFINIKVPVPHHF